MHGWAVGAGTFAPGAAFRGTVRTGAVAWAVGARAFAWWAVAVRAAATLGAIGTAFGAACWATFWGWRAIVPVEFEAFHDHRFGVEPEVDAIGEVGREAFFEGAGDSGEGAAIDGFGCGVGEGVVGGEGLHEGRGGVGEDGVAAVGGPAGPASAGAFAVDGAVAASGPLADVVVAGDGDAAFGCAGAEEELAAAAVEDGDGGGGELVVEFVLDTYFVTSISGCGDGSDRLQDGGAGGVGGGVGE